MSAGNSQTAELPLPLKPVSSRDFMKAGKTGSVAAVAAMHSRAAANTFQCGRT